MGYGIRQVVGLAIVFCHTRCHYTIEPHAFALDDSRGWGVKKYASQQ